MWGCVCPLPRELSRTWGRGSTCPRARPGVRAGSGPLPSRPPSGLPARPPGHTGGRSPDRPSCLRFPQEWSGQLAEQTRSHRSHRSHRCLGETPPSRDPGRAGQHGVLTGRPVPAPCPPLRRPLSSPGPWQQGGCLPPHQHVPKSRTRTGSLQSALPAGKHRAKPADLADSSEARRRPRASSASATARKASLHVPRSSASPHAARTHTGSRIKPKPGWDNVLPSCLEGDHPSPLLLPRRGSSDATDGLHGPQDRSPT